ncbi:MAG: hypothetical protein HYX28_00365 [Candidatus Koribacter versatilis]|uniref:Type II secretion system protein n=1 Tax=Candidatus Korobacter versatilis TaxID=658062 RepID=A0A932EPN8_9BACT|nr:hypothetical protein [Candidatus Koribacter versatilis]
MKVSSHFSRPNRRLDAGYVLMVILLMLALLIISLLAIAPREATQIRREREAETIRRGNEYARAVKRFYRKVGRYPVRIEELENTNNTRFLRKRYVDPMTGQEFRVLHYGEQKSVPKGLFGAPMGVTGGGGIGGVGAGGAGGGLPGAIIGNAMGGGASAAGSMGAPAFGGTAPGGNSDQSRSPQSPGTPASSLSSPLGGGTTFGGGPIIGVAGTKDQASIKDWNGKTNYRDWEFYYDPRFDQQQQPQGVGLPNGLGQPNNTGQPAGGQRPNNPPPGGSRGPK